MNLLLDSALKATIILFAAWTADGTRWTTSSPLPTGSSQVLASGTGPCSTAWVLLTGGRAAIITGPGSAWRQLLALPQGTAALATVSGAAVDARALDHEVRQSLEHDATTVVGLHHRREGVVDHEGLEEDA